MNAQLMIPALLLAIACPSLMAADAKHDDHGAAHAAPAQDTHDAHAKPAAPKPADKPAGDAKPVTEVKVADAHAEEPAKPAPKKKRAKKAR